MLTTCACICFHGLFSFEWWIKKNAWNGNGHGHWKWNGWKTHRRNIRCRKFGLISDFVPFFTMQHTRAFSFRHANLRKKYPHPPTSCPESNNNDMISLSAEQIIIEMMSVLLTNNLNLLRFFPVLDKVSKWLRTLGQTKKALFVCMNTPVKCICIIPFHWNVPCEKTDNIFRSCFHHVKLTFTFNASKWLKLE